MRICQQSRSCAAVTSHPFTPHHDAPNGIYPCDAICQKNMFLFSSETGKELVCEILRDLWPHTPRDYQIEAVVKLLDGINVLAILLTSASKTTILVMLMLLLDHIQLSPKRFPSPQLPPFSTRNPTFFHDDSISRLYKTAPSVSHQWCSNPVYTPTMSSCP